MWNGLSKTCKFDVNFYTAMILNSKLLNWRSAVQWNFPLWSKWVSIFSLVRDDAEKNENKVEKRPLFLNRRKEYRSCCSKKWLHWVKRFCHSSQLMRTFERRKNKKKIWSSIGKSIFNFRPKQGKRVRWWGHFWNNFGRQTYWGMPSGVGWVVFKCRKQ